MGRTVLLIEDDPTIADFMEVVLEKRKVSYSSSRDWNGCSDDFSGTIL